ncbi:MAG: redoxin family protein [Sulfurovum sp.]
MKIPQLKTIVKEITIALLILFVLSNTISYIRKPNLPIDKIPKIEAKLLNGKKFIAENGKPLLIHFWATWCPTCKLEAPNIEYISKKYSEYHILTIAVNSGSNEDVRDYIQKRNFTFGVINDKDAVLAKDFNIKAYPTTLIYDKDGKLKFSEVGYTTTAGLLTRLSIL